MTHGREMPEEPANEGEAIRPRGGVPPPDGERLRCPSAQRCWVYAVPQQLGHESSELRSWSLDRFCLPTWAPSTQRLLGGDMEDSDPVADYSARGPGFSDYLAGRDARLILAAASGSFR